jgi:hypothetical protein
MFRVSRDEVGLHVVATMHMEKQIREQANEPQFHFTCQCIACKSMYKHRELMQSIVNAVCRDIMKERLESN